MSLTLAERWDDEALCDLVAQQEADDKPYITDPVAWCSLDKTWTSHFGQTHTLADFFGIDPETGEIINFLPREVQVTPWGAIPHGTISGYTNYRCRCGLCRQSNADFARKRRRLRLVPRHGTESGYRNHACRCAACRAAAVNADRERRKKKAA